MGSVSRRVPSNAFARSGGLRVAREVSRSPNSRVSAAATHSELPVPSSISMEQNPSGGGPGKGGPKPAGTEPKWEVPIVEIHCVGGVVVASYSEMNTLPDFFGSVTDLQSRPMAEVESVIQTVRAQTFVRLGQIKGELGREQTPAVKAGEEPGQQTTSGRAAALDRYVPGGVPRAGQSASQHRRSGQGPGRGRGAGCRRRSRIHRQGDR